MQRAYLASTRALSALLLVLGLVLIATTLARGGGGLALGMFVGVCFTVLGAGRLWLARGGTR